MLTRIFLKLKSVQLISVRYFCCSKLRSDEKCDERLSGRKRRKISSRTYFTISRSCQRNWINSPLKYSCHSERFELSYKLPECYILVYECPTTVDHGPELGRDLVWFVSSRAETNAREYFRWGGLGARGALPGDWRDAVSEAERVVGYPTSFLNLRWLFNDEIANTAIHLRKLVGTNHPLLKSAKNLLIGSKSNLQSVGLIVLLVSKAAGFNTQDYTRDLYDSGVLHAQRGLAEIVEMKRTGHMIHKTMANLQEKEKLGEKFKDLLYGNKIVLLTGDYLFATCLQQLGGLRNNDVTELISTGLRDLVEGDFLGEHDDENNPLPSQPKASNDITNHYSWDSENNLNKLGSNEFLGQGKDEWILRTMLTSGSLLGKGCQGAMKLARRGEQIERDAYKLGGHLALLWQLYLDVRDFFTHPYSYSLVGAPVIFALWEYPTIYGHILEAKVGKKPIEYKQLYYAVRGTRSMEYLSIFLDEELEAILKCSEKFPVEEAKLALQKMALTVHGEALQYMET